MLKHKELIKEAANASELHTTLGLFFQKHVMRRMVHSFQKSWARNKPLNLHSASHINHCYH